LAIQEYYCLQYFVNLPNLIKFGLFGAGMKCLNISLKVWSVTHLTFIMKCSFYDLSQVAS